MIWTFAGIRAALVKLLKGYDNWKKEILSEGVYANIIDAVSYIFEKVAYTVDFRFIETTSKAQLTESIIDQSRFLGYTPPRKKGAPGILTIGTDPTFETEYLKYEGRDVTINKWQGFSDADGTVFVYATEGRTFYRNTIQKSKPMTGQQSAVQISSSVVGLPVIGHGFLSGDEIKVNRTQNYDGIYTVLPSSTADRIHVTANYTAEVFSGQERISSGYMFLPVKQGIVKTFNYISVGLIEEEIPIYSSSIDETEIQVEIVDVNDNVIASATKVDDLYFVNDLTTYNYEIENFSDYTGIYIRFGDGITARQLAAQERLRITYAETEGKDGDIGSSDIISQSLETIVNDLNVEVEMFITNEAPIVGGSNLLDNERIRKVSGALFDAGYQLNKRSAWEAAIEEVTYIDRAKVWTELDLGNGTVSLAGTANQNVHYVTALTTTGQGLTVSQESQISSEILIPRKSPTDVIAWKKLKKVGIKFDVNAWIKPLLSIPNTQQEISNTLQDNYDVLQLEFKQDIFESNYINVIDDIDAIIRHKTEASYIDENIPVQEVLLETLINSPPTEQPDKTKQILIADESPEIWLRRKINFQWQDAFPIAEISVVSFQGLNTYTVSGDVDYTNSKVTYQCFDLINDIVPSITRTGQSFNNNNRLLVSDTSNLALGMYVFGLNLQDESVIVEITENETVTLNKPTNSTGAGTGTLTFCKSSDPGQSFGLRNPNDSDEKGFILYLVYKTVDGNGDRLNDLRTGNFDEIFDYSPELSQFNLVYET